MVAISRFKSGHQSGPDFPGEQGPIGFSRREREPGREVVVRQVQRPLATVIVGGMLLGPVMLLLAVPALRMMFLGRDNHPHPPSEELL